MSLFRLGSIGGRDVSPSEREIAAGEAKVREAQIAFARRNDRWTEIAPAARLVKRGPFLVDAETDFVYSVYRGQVFGWRSVTALIPDVSLTFFLNRADELVFLERAKTARTWSEIVERRERAKANAA